MEKDIDKIQKNPETDIIIRIDDFGGKVGLTIREFVKSERYSGFTKAGTRIPADKFRQFKDAINSIDEEEFKRAVASMQSQAPTQQQNPAYIAYKDKKQTTFPNKKFEKREPVQEQPQELQEDSEEMFM